jgi:hypothetical protein
MQINTMSTGDSEGPAWNKFWLSLDHETESMVSGDGSHRPNTPGRPLMSPDLSRPLTAGLDSVLPNESASHNGDESHSEVAEHSPIATEDAPFPFKFKAPSGRVHRTQVIASAGLAELITAVTGKLGGEIEAVGGPASYENGKIGDSGYALSYLDNEGDTVSITTDQDLLDAISLARRTHRDKVDLFVHNPAKPPVSATVEPRPGLPKPASPPASVLKDRRRQAIEESEEEVEALAKRERKPAIHMNQEQVVPGVPNELLLPGAIATLAIVIVAVFAIGRSTSSR